VGASARRSPLIQAALPASALPLALIADRADRPLEGGEPLVQRSPLVDTVVRVQLIEANRPKLRDFPAMSPVSDDDPGRARQRAGEILEAASDYTGARTEYGQAIALGNRESWWALARVSLRTGDWDTAEAAYLAALELARDREDPLAQGVSYRALGEVYLHSGRPAAALLALERAHALLPRSQRVLTLLTRARFPIDARSIPYPSPGPLVWPSSVPPAAADSAIAESPARAAAWRDGPARAFRSLYAVLPEPVRSVIDSLSGWDRLQPALVTAIVLLVLLVVLRLSRHRGDLAVTIEYPDELRGTFNVRLSGKKGKGQSERLGRAAVLKGATSSRSEHHLVSRETLFPGLPAGRYGVIIEGILRSPNDDETLADCFERKEVRVLHWRTVRVEFDVRPRSCPVDVVVLWGDEPAREASVAVWGEPELRGASRGAPVRMMLGKGRHRLAVGSGDRVRLVAVEVQSFLPTRFLVDIGGSQDVSFKGCPPAVEPYLRADVPAAAVALERDGQGRRAQLLLAQWHRDEGRPDRAAVHFEAADHFLEAAELRSDLSDFERAAELFIEAREPLSAAEMYRSAGQLLKAGDAFEEARDFDSAIECYRDSGEVVKWIEALERRGQTFEAARVAFDNGERGRGIRLLQRVGSDESEHSRACVLLADAYEQEGHWDLAAQKLEEYIASSGPSATSADLYDRLASLLEQAGYVERALELLEDLRRREPTHPNLAARIELLRKQRSANRDRDWRGLSPDDAAPTTLMAEKRYELLREIGRGGMGIVYQARDRRLGRVVALKQLPERLIEEHPRAVQRFLNEAQAAAQLNHPNIVTVYDTDREDGTFFITMEMLMGESLHAVLRREGRMPERTAVQLGRQVTAGLEYAHQRGIVHRDIKTANLFLTSENVVKIMDFGLAKILEEVRGASTLLGGTPFYMSPEQVLGEALDPRSDLYSLGVTLYELSTGQVPFYEGEVAYHHCHTAPVDPRRRVGNISDEFAELVLQLLEKKVEDRCASSSEVGERLEALLRD